MEFLPLAIMMLSWGCYCCEVTVFPDFEPNEYLFTTHADKGQERWAIYAWALREILAKHGGFGQCNIPVRSKLALYKWMTGGKGAIDPLDLEVDDLHQSMLMPAGAAAGGSVLTRFNSKIDELEELARDFDFQLISSDYDNVQLFK